MIRIAIVEDESEYIRLLTDYLHRYEQESGQLFQIRTYPDGLDITEDYTADHDIILMDIQMKHLDGMKAAQIIRGLDENVTIIFITSTVQYAVQGYTVDALGYVVKPVTYHSFANLIGKAVSKTEHEQQKHFCTVKTETGVQKIDLNNVLYIEAQRHNIVIHSVRAQFTTAGPMKKFEESLSGLPFSKCHNAYLVNLQYVDSILQNDVLLSDGTSLPISRARKKAFLDDLTNFMGGSW